MLRGRPTTKTGRWIGCAATSSDQRALSCCMRSRIASRRTMSWRSARRPSGDTFSAVAKASHTIAIPPRNSGSTWHAVFSRALARSSSRETGTPAQARLSPAHGRSAVFNSGTHTAFRLTASHRLK